MTYGHSATLLFICSKYWNNSHKSNQGCGGLVFKILFKCSQIDEKYINFCDWICLVFFYEAVVVTLTFTQHESICKRITKANLK